MRTKVNRVISFVLCIAMLCSTISFNTVLVDAENTDNMDSASVTVSGSSADTNKPTVSMNCGGLTTITIEGQSDCTAVVDGITILNGESNNLDFVFYDKSGNIMKDYKDAYINYDAEKKPSLYVSFYDRSVNVGCIKVYEVGKDNSPEIFTINISNVNPADKVFSGNNRDVTLNYYNGDNNTYTLSTVKKDADNDDGVVNVTTDNKIMIPIIGDADVQIAENRGDDFTVIDSQSFKIDKVGDFALNLIVTKFKQSGDISYKLQRNDQLNIKAEEKNIKYSFYYVKDGEVTTEKATLVRNDDNGVYWTKYPVKMVLDEEYKEFNQISFEEDDKPVLIDSYVFCEDKEVHDYGTVTFSSVSGNHVVTTKLGSIGIDQEAPTVSSNSVGIYMDHNRIGEDDGAFYCEPGAKLVFDANIIDEKSGVGKTILHYTLKGEDGKEKTYAVEYAQGKTVEHTFEDGEVVTNVYVEVCDQLDNSVSGYEGYEKIKQEPANQDNNDLMTCSIEDQEEQEEQDDNDVNTKELLTFNGRYKTAGSETGVYDGYSKYILAESGKDYALSMKSINVDRKKEYVAEKTNAAVDIDISALNNRSGITNIKYLVDGVECDDDDDFEKQVKASYSGKIRFGYAGFVNETGEEQKPVTTAQKKVANRDETSRINGNVSFKVYTNAHPNGITCTTSQKVDIYQIHYDEPNVYVDVDPQGNQFEDKCSRNWYKSGNVDADGKIRVYLKNIAGAENAKIKCDITSEDIDGKIENKTFVVGSKEEIRNSVFDVDNNCITINDDSITEIKVSVFDEYGNGSKTYIYKIAAAIRGIDPNAVAMKINGTPHTLGTDASSDISYGCISRENIVVDVAMPKVIKGYAAQNIGVFSSGATVKLDGTSASIADGKYTVKENTRGVVAIYLRDSAGNEYKAWSDGIIRDDAAPKLYDIKMSAEPNANGFYNAEKLSATCKIEENPALKSAGINDVLYQIESENGKKNSEHWNKLDVKPSTSIKQSQIIEEYTGKFDIDSKLYEGNDVKLTVTALDNAENDVKLTKSIKIDVTKPVVDIKFDKKFDAKTKYIKDDVVATITVKERNFAKEGFELLVTRNGKSVPVKTGAWTYDSNTNTATTKVTFHDDGVYTVSARCKDMADNVSKDLEVQRFVIDQMGPRVKITFDNNSIFNKKFYNKSRVATIVVEEENFDENLFKLDIEGVVRETKWREDGINHIKTVIFEKDGEYNINYSGKDLAGNACEKYEGLSFVVDTTLPNIKVEGVKDKSANMGDVHPVVTVSELHFDEKSTDVFLENSKGEKIKLKVVKTPQENGMVYDLTNVNGLDDSVYFLNVESTDKANNTANVVYRFSLNRNGSTYDLSKLVTMTKNKYVRYDDLSDIEILETNIDKIDDFSIYLSKNSEMILNEQEGKRPSVFEPDTIYYNRRENGNYKNGYTYTYTVYKENFADEGVYNLTFYSKDRAGNEVNSSMNKKGDEVVFIVDNTAPMCTISGVLEGEYFKDDTDINVMISDNFKLKEATIQVIDKNENVLKSYDYLKEVKDEGDILSLNIKTDGKACAVVYSAIDMAGNKVTIIPSEVREIEAEKAKEAAAPFIIDEAIVEGSKIWLTILLSVVSVFAIGGIAVYVVLKRRKK